MVLSARTAREADRFPRAVRWAAAVIFNALPVCLPPPPESWQEGCGCFMAALVMVGLGLLGIMALAESCGAPHP